MKNMILIWVLFLGFLLIWFNFFEPLLWIVFQIVGFPSTVIRFLLVVLYLLFTMEIGIKFLMLGALQPMQFVFAQSKGNTKLDIDTIDNYTIALEEQGFVQLGDYTESSINGIIRLLVNPQLQCYAEIAQVYTVPIFCSISSVLEDNWLVIVSNEQTKKPLAFAYAFVRQPQFLIKQVTDSSTEVLLQSFLDWRKQITTDLGVNPIALMTVEESWAITNRLRSEQRKILSRRSIIWSQIQAIRFWINPKDEWLGDYAKLKSD